MDETLFLFRRARTWAALRGLAGLALASSAVLAGVMPTAQPAMAIGLHLLPGAGAPGYEHRTPAQWHPFAKPSIVAMRKVVGDACDTEPASPSRCDLAVLQVIDEERAAQGLAPLVLPPRYEDMSPAGQLVVVTNAEREARGLPAWEGPDAALGRLAWQGVAAGTDPNGPAGTAWASNWAGGVLTVLQADYEWVYDDGPGGPNAACRAPGQPACWAHRDNLLAPWAGEVGAAGARARQGRLDVAEVMAARR
jgi:hypothetical protein